MARATQPALDPTRDAASLLGRVGYILLFAAWPGTAYLGSGGVLVLLPLAAALLTAQALLNPAVVGSPRERLGRLARSLPLLAAAVGLGWAALSLIWSPEPRSSLPRLAATVTVLGLGLALLLALPERMRSANNYLVPIGATLGAAVGIGLWLAAGVDAPETARRLERGLAVGAVLAWPAIAWLRSRGRDPEAIGLGLLAAVAAVTAPDLAPVLAVACGALGFLLATLAGRAGALGLGLAMGAVILAAPVAAYLTGSTDPATATGLDAWRAAVRASPVQILTGHGFGTLPAFSPVMILPGAPLLDLWFELGLVAAAAAAVALVLGLRAGGGRDPALAPGITATFATAFALALSGIDRGEAWWPATLVVAGLAFAAAERGQVRTRRPRALVFGRPAAPSGVRSGR